MMQLDFFRSFSKCSTWATIW